jgi:hypothetical protein
MAAKAESLFITYSGLKFMRTRAFLLKYGAKVQIIIKTTCVSSKKVQNMVDSAKMSVLSWLARY